MPRSPRTRLGRSGLTVAGVWERLRAEAHRRAPVHVPVAAIDRSGVVTTTDGSVVRVLELTPRGSLRTTGPLVEALELLVDGLAPGDGLQWYVERRTLRRDRVLASLADGARLSAHADPRLADLAARDHAWLRGRLGDPAAVELGTYVVLRETPQKRRDRGQHEQLLQRSLLRADAIRDRLTMLGLRPRLLDGPAVSRLLLRRIHSGASPPLERSAEMVGVFDAERDAEQAATVATRLLDHLRGAAVDFSADPIVRIGGDLEQTVYVGAAPSATRRDWLAPLRPERQSHVLAIHVRRAGDDLRMSVYETIRDAGPEADPVRLATAVDAAVREGSAESGARIDRGEFIQRQLWQSTLPLAVDAAGVTHAVSARAVARSLPVVGDGTGSPDGIAFARCLDGTLARLDPWDAAHAQAALAVAGGTGEVRAAAAVGLVGRLAARGARVAVVDLDGTLAERLAALGDVVDVRAASAREDVVAGASPVLVLDASSAPEPLDVLDETAELLAGATPTPVERGDDAPAWAGALVVWGVDELAAAPESARWLRGAIVGARRDGRCVIAWASSLRPLLGVGVLPVLPSIVLLRHDGHDAEALGVALGLSPAEVSAVADDGDVALWLNGDRGRVRVRLLGLPSADREAIGVA